MTKTTAQGGQIDGGRELATVEMKDPLLGRLIRRVLDGVNTGFTNAGISPGGQISPPKPPDQVQVKVAGETVHTSLSHTGELNRNVTYFTEVGVNDPAFGEGNTVINHHGSSRTPPPFTLPTYLDDGVTKQTYYIRSFAQYPGGPPSAPYVVGGVGSPTPFQMSGTTGMTLLPSFGSGTGPNTGQAGQGLGNFQKRLISQFGGSK